MKEHLHNTSFYELIQVSELDPRGEPALHPSIHLGGGPPIRGQSAVFKYQTKRPVNCYHTRRPTIERFLAISPDYLRQAYNMETPLDLSLISLRRIIRVTEAGARELAKNSRMATTELLTLQAVADTPGLSPGALARGLSLSPVTSTVILQKLEAKGLIEKIRSPSDKRKLQVQLTEKGRMEVDAAPSSVQSRFIEGFEQLPVWEQHQIAAVLSKVTALMHAENLEAAPILQIGPLA